MTESFEDARISAQAIMSDCDIPLLDRLQKAHDHDMEQLRRLRFREGYEAGQRSMDAEHYAVALRLKHLPLDEDSHGNLSQIARAVWHSDFGWTRDACEALRDELVRLLGGVHEIKPDDTASGACDADCDCGNQQPQAVAYDELGNERHKAVCELRKMPDTYKGKKPTRRWYMELCDAIGVGYATTFANVRDRLIHLLGGDEPFPNFSEPNLPKSAEIAKPESEDGGENCRITDELRDCVEKATKTYDDTPWHELGDGYEADHTICHITEGELLGIADRIDEQFKRICWQQEDVLQHTIDTMVDERDKLRAMLTQQRDEARAKVLKLDNEVSELQAKRDEYKSLFERYRDSYVQYVGEYNVLQRALRRIAKRAGVPDEVDFSECDNAMLHKLTIEHIDSMHEYIGALEWQRDRQRKLLDEYERRDTVEDIVRDIHLGKVTDSEAVERIRALP